MANTKTICHKCHQEVDVSQVNYVPTGKDEMMIVCNACSGKPSSNTVVNTEVPIKKHTVAPKPAEKTEKKTRYFCGRCKYKFKHKSKSATSLKCPYCGKSDKIMEDKSDAKSILTEISDPTFDEKNIW